MSPYFLLGSMFCFLFVVIGGQMLFNYFREMLKEEMLHATDTNPTPERTADTETYVAEKWASVAIEALEDSWPLTEEEKETITEWLSENQLPQNLGEELLNMLSKIPLDSRSDIDKVMLADLKAIQHNFPEYWNGLQTRGIKKSAREERLDATMSASMDKLIPSFIRQKGPFSIGYNVLCIGLSFTSLALMLAAWFSYEGSALVCGGHMTKEELPLWKTATWVFYISKFIEFWDTFFMVARQPQAKRQLSFLHIYHHFSIPFVVWIYIMQNTGSMEWLPVSLNSFIHVVMYIFQIFTQTSSGFNRCDQSHRLKPEEFALFKNT